jgi:hypothetical protein
MALAGRQGERVILRARETIRSGRASGQPREIRETRLLFSTAHPGRFRAVTLFDLRGDAARQIREVAALVEDQSGALLGLVAIDQAAGELYLVDPNGQTRWRARVQGLRGDAAYALLDAGRLYVAPFQPLSGGAELYALDWQSGALVWRGDVRELNAPHEEYSHDVRLSLAGGNLVFEGVEGAGCTLQLFDRASGARKLELTQRNPESAQ